jgi:hypothetical protein
MPSYTYDYSTRYQPYAPVVDILISSPDSPDRQLMLSALVDSGADATMLPIAALQAIGALYVQPARIQGVTGVPSAVDIYSVSVQVGPRRIHTVDAIAIRTGAEAILGRDVLNQLVVTMDGPVGVTTIST